jgi:hypothetical protein
VSALTTCKAWVDDVFSLLWTSTIERIAEAIVNENIVNFACIRRLRFVGHFSLSFWNQTFPVSDLSRTFALSPLRVTTQRGRSCAQATDLCITNDRSRRQTVTASISRIQYPSSPTT